MKLNVQKRIAAAVLNCSEKRVVLDTSKLSEIKEAITKDDIRRLINEGTISKRQEKGISKFRARKIKRQKVKGRRSGHGSRKGKKGARLDPKGVWINRIRLQRRLIKTLKNKKMVEPSVYKDLYRKSKGGFFRSKRHLQLYLTEHNLIKKAK